MKLFILVVLMQVMFVSLALAHSGRTDSRGCHRNHKTGTYHCH